eukprot:CAMPEP_0184871992 /NCGR_PEP_ID=MMETSP0580-20130426/41034_1 /TAXON_ID=1118495 /ORGANISM="Dactyliosolen fragilissimus" /LENGTH=208 /DNA_ID=CAMNT_0027374725 /DNA_START=118 /DNA_END=744 /DNA_ORIENTATION=+
MIQTLGTNTSFSFRSSDRQTRGRHERCLDDENYSNTKTATTATTTTMTTTNDRRTPENSIMEEVYEDEEVGCVTTMNLANANRYHGTATITDTDDSAVDSASTIIFTDPNIHNMNNATVDVHNNERVIELPVAVASPVVSTVSTDTVTQQRPTELQRDEEEIRNSVLTEITEMRREAEDRRSKLCALKIAISCLVIFLRIMFLALDEE